MKHLRRDDQILCRLYPGEELHDSLRRLARLEGIPSAALTGLGAVGEITLAYYDLVRRAYLPTVLKEDVEIVSLTGNLAWDGAEPMPHLHAVVSRPDGATLGGHVVRAVVSATLEISIRIFNARIERRLDPATGLKLLELE